MTGDSVGSEFVLANCSMGVELASTNSNVPL
jgi:hypothetical protein